MKMSTTWSPLSLTRSPYCVLVLNRPFTVPNFEALWNEASIRICVDGGANRLFELKTKLPSLKNPDLITGDFDSIEETVKSHYEKQGVKTVQTPDQSFTDFTKSLMTIENGIATGDFPQVDIFIAATDCGGRVDQAFANICTLFKTKLKVYLLDEHTVTWLLRSGSHSLQFDDNYVASKPHCGLIPLCGITKIKSNGLVWDLDGEYHFHGMISTNNLIKQTTLQIETEHDILWTMDI